MTSEFRAFFQVSGLFRGSLGFFFVRGFEGFDLGVSGFLGVEDLLEVNRFFLEVQGCRLV